MVPREGSRRCARFPDHGSAWRDRDCPGRPTAGLSRHLLKPRQKLGDVGIVGPARVWYPPVTVANCAPGAVRERTARR